MTKEQLQIQTAYGRIVKRLDEMRDEFMADAVNGSQDFEGISADDAEIWFLEGF